MFRHLFTIFILVLNVNLIFCTEFIRRLLQKFIDDNDSNVVRVRTPAERDRRWEEFVILDFIGLVQQYKGYIAEEHKVQTPDGYILTLHRIKGSPSSPPASGKSVVYMQHGLFASSDFFVVLGPQQALAFQLADAGYDVWLGNVRGNTYSKKHVNYTSITVDNKQFWNYCMDEIATLDVPTFIDAVLAKTNQKKLTYIGYSMGTTVSYILLSEKPEYNNKMNLVVSIAPTAYFSHPMSQSLVLLSNTMFPLIKSMFLYKNIYQVFHQSKIFQIIGKDLCYYDGSPCQLFLQGITNYLNYTQLPAIFAHAPAGASLTTLDHYYQIVSSGKFQKYNPGVLNSNGKIMSRTEAYDLSKISSPQALFYSDGDVLSDVKDVEKLKSQLSNVKISVKNPTTYNHMDFMWAQNAKREFNYKVLEIIQKFSES